MHINRQKAAQHPALHVLLQAVLWINYSVANTPSILHIIVCCRPAAAVAVGTRLAPMEATSVAP